MGVKIKNMKYNDFQDNETLEIFKQTGGNVLLTTVDDVID
jgi:NADH-quinone oxidoreductase subunit B